MFKHTILLALEAKHIFMPPLFLPATACRYLSPQLLAACGCSFRQKTSSQQFVFLPVLLQNLLDSHPLAHSFPFAPYTQYSHHCRLCSPSVSKIPMIQKSHDSLRCSHFNIVRFRLAGFGSDGCVALPSEADQLTWCGS